MDESFKLKRKSDEQLKLTRFCTICKKGFASGKALGGHMRIHYQDSSSQSKLNNGGNSPICPVCDKTFQSWKSLYGHMRCHPDRQWRGILAPFSQSEEEEDEEEVGEASEKSESDTNGSGSGSGLWFSVLPGWAITGKRGRRGASPAPESEVWEAADTLICLAGGESGFVLDSKRKRGRPRKESELDVNGGRVKEKKKRGRKKKNHGEEEGKDPNRVGNPDQDPDCDPNFRCVTCNKEFLTYQALGGHRSKHYKEKNGGSLFLHSGSGEENGSTREEVGCSVGPTPVAAGDGAAAVCG